MTNRRAMGKWGKRAWPALALLGLACAEPSARRAPSGDLVIEPLMYTPETEPIALLEPGGEIDLVLPPQGGFVVLVGAQIDHTDSDVVDLYAALRDPSTGEVIEEQSRNVKLQRLPGHPTKFVTDRRSSSQVVHLTLCPTEQPLGIDGRELELTVSAVELYSDFSEGSATLSITPVCGSDDPIERAQCECQCRPGYSLQKCTDIAP